MSAGYFHDVPMSDYLADKLSPEPSLSTSTVDLLVHKTPLHARMRHPRLSKWKDYGSNRGDLGSAIHSLVLGGNPVVYCGEVERKSGKAKGEKYVPDTWATDDAKAFKQLSYSADAIPLLECQREQVERASEAARELLATLGKGKAEVTMSWQLPNGVWCRGRADFLTDLYDVDLKTCDDADPAMWQRRNINGPYRSTPSSIEIQAGLRSLGHIALGQPRTMIWLLQEIEPPYCNSLVGFGDSLMPRAHDAIEKAAWLWRDSLDFGDWPGYSRKPTWAEISNAYGEVTE